MFSEFPNFTVYVLLLMEDFCTSRSLEYHSPYDLLECSVEVLKFVFVYFPGEPKVTVGFVFETYQTLFLFACVRVFSSICSLVCFHVCLSSCQEGVGTCVRVSLLAIALLYESPGRNQVDSLPPASKCILLQIMI